MNNYEFCCCGTRELKYLPDHYYLIMHGGEFWLMAIKILSDPSKKDVPKSITNIINKIKQQGDISDNKGLVKIGKDDLITLCNYKEITNVNILNNGELFNEMKKGIYAYLNNLNANDSLIKAESINDLDSLKSFVNYIKNYNISMEVKNILLSYVRVCLIEFSTSENSEIISDIKKTIKYL